MARAHQAALRLGAEAEAQAGQEGEEQEVDVRGQAQDAALVRAAGATAGGGGGANQAGGGRAEQARDGGRARHRGGRRGGRRRRARRRRSGPPHREDARIGSGDDADADPVQPRTRRPYDPIRLPRIPREEGAASVEGAGAAAGADPGAGGAAADGGDAARPRVAHEDPGAAARQGLLRRRRPPIRFTGARRHGRPAPARQGAVLRRRRRRSRAAAEQGVGQQHAVEGGDERHEPEQGGGRPQARPRAAVRLAPPEREGRWDEEAADEQGGDGDAEPAVELAGGVGRIAAAVRQGHPRRAPISKQGCRRRRRRTSADGAPLQVQGRQARLRRRWPQRRRRRRQAARVLGQAVLHPRREAHAGEGRRRLRGGGAVPGVHGVDGVRQGQVPVHEHAQGALRRRRGGRLLRAVLPVRRPPAVADPLHVADPVHRQRHRLREVQPAGGGAAVAAGEGAHDADEVPVPEVAGTPQLRLRSRAAPAADGAVHPYPVKRNSKHVMQRTIKHKIHAFL